jgi:hypothetical protein
MASSIEKGPVSLPHQAEEIGCLMSRNWLWVRGWGYESNDGTEYSLARRVLAACNARKVGRRIEWGKGKSHTSRFGNAVISRR